MGKDIEAACGQLKGRSVVADRKQEIESVNSN